MNFIMAHLHVDSLKNSFEIIKEIFLYNTDVFAVSETKLDDIFSVVYYTATWATFKSKLKK